MLMVQPGGRVGQGLEDLGRVHWKGATGNPFKERLEPMADQKVFRYIKED